MVNGGGGLRRAGLASTLATVNAAFSSACLNASASAPEPISSRWIFLPSAPTSRTLRVSIAPASALVRVDEVDAEVIDGKIDVTGLPGSVHRVELRLGTDGPDDLCAERACDLDAGAADAAGGRRDEHPRAVADGHLSRQRDPGREKREHERRALLEARPLGQVEQPGALGDRAFRVAAAVRADERDHATAVLGLPGDL